MKKFVLAAAAALCVAAAPAMAQDAPAAAPAPAAPKASFTDADVASFAKAAVKVQVISQQARSQMMQAIESTEGLTIETYNAIVQAAQKDPELAKKISGLMADYAKDAGVPQSK